MERYRAAGSPAYGRQQSISSPSGERTSPTSMSPVYPSQLNQQQRHVRSGSAGVGTFRRAQNNAARAAAQRLARVMAHQHADDDEEEDEEDDLLSGPPIELSTPRRAARSPSPAISRYLADQTPVRPTPVGRLAVGSKPVTIIPSIRSSQRPLTSAASSDSLSNSQRSEAASLSVRRDKVMSIDLGHLSMRQPSSAQSSSKSQDEIESLQDESENNTEKLAEDIYDEAESKAGQVEKQVASVGEGLSVESRLFARKQEALQKREAAMKAASQTGNATKEISTLRAEAKIARDEAASASEQLQEAESELKSLKTMAHKMILSQELMEEVVLKRCWLARYWQLCVNYGIYADIAESKFEFWSSFSPLPLEVVLSAGQKAREAKDGYSSDKSDQEDKEVSWNASDLSGEGTIESMLLVEKGLRELTSLKVEEAILFIMAQERRASAKCGTLILPEGQNPVEAFELNQEESEDVDFKQAWLTYFWRRAKNHGLEEDIADERLQFWIEQSNHSPTSHDAVEVERGLVELKKLGIEWQLWEVCHR
ncbi:coiled-coil domain-containing protein SCD2-like isoform X1 [Zingiber officinale]|uniref:coiled-coil domain-containing protein SCD2-like isoform X1 n=1 Tax=Zingiber officinale TaxID=94328 RepID=UPI001C4AEAFF|nr:coiled-coil domain-containing protein SCD2-like isoform X1 [Zingiber officinale]XP_042395537.1 coiled-coil domain-containing protein SCD2-like isoform X1 [Zingiber officinale]